MTYQYCSVESECNYQAIRIIRVKLGSECIILSNKKVEDYFVVKAISSSFENNIDNIKTLINILEYCDFSEHFINNVLSKYPIINNISHDLRYMFNFGSISDLASNIVLISTTGCGKTATSAKISLYYDMKGIQPGIISCDTQKTCGALQLARIVKKLGLNIKITDDPWIAKSYITSYEYNIIDTGGINIRNIKEYDYIQNLINITKAEPILVLRPDMSSKEIGSLCKEFKELGAKHAIITNLDVVHTYGPVIENCLKFNIIPLVLSNSPYISDPIHDGNKIAHFIIQNYKNNNSAI